MQKRKKWQLFVILAVLALTLYNILPTVFYYCQPLRQPIGEQQGKKIAKTVGQRVDQLEKDSLEWLDSFCHLIHVKPLYIRIDRENPQIISLSFAKAEEAKRFRALLPRSGSLIPFAPAQLSLAPSEALGNEVLVQRHIPLRFSEEENLFSFISIEDPKYRDLILDRACQIALLLSGPSEPAKSLERGETSPSALENLAGQINTLSQVFDAKDPIRNRFAARFTQGNFENRTNAIQSLIGAFDQLRDQIKREKETHPELQQLEDKILRAENYVKKYLHLFANGEDPFSLSQLEQILRDNASVQLKNPLFSQLLFDGNKIVLKWHSDVSERRSSGTHFEQLVIDEIAKVQRFTEEQLVQTPNGVEILLHRLPNTSSFLALDLEKVAHLLCKQTLASLKKYWNPEHPDLRNLPIVEASEYSSLPPEQQALCLILYAPVSDSSALFPDLHNQSIYVIAKGVEHILQNYRDLPESELAHTFLSDFQKLKELLSQSGFFGYPNATGFLFEKPNYYRSLLKATREDFITPGRKRFALLEFSDLEQRLLTENKIETQIHEDLVKWHDEFRSAKVSLDSRKNFDAPQPTRSIFWSNLTLSARKFFRGDDRKILRWGLDLSGGKTVQIALRNQNGEMVKGDAELKQGINELYRRVNKMGMAEVSIRQLGHHIVLDFPGSQALSASELIQASSMQFHIVNEKFSTQNPSLADSVNRFLQEVWNRAVVLGIKDPLAIHRLAWQHLEDPRSRNDAAQVLWENGLRLSSPDHPLANTVDESLSKIAVLRESPQQSHPLLIVFHNHALEGTYLKNIHAGYDPSKGNYLSFEVSGPHLNREHQRIHPQADLYAWTSLFSKEKILGTPKELFSRGYGWRMAVLLNGFVISAPTLEAALRDQGSIHGNFSQREVSQLAADLKAGSLTFTPQILSEKNVSPELGKTDRMKGIAATIAALFLVVAAMIAYYRFAGVIASIAVLFNLLILWAILQNLGATLTLAGLAGVILTVGMAVDANVLVFERVKEEFALSGRIAAALDAGYKKAFSAILDSNITTIIAALILLNFDAGPIKSFAMNLIIGIASSMFTALFMTRYYFAKWVENPKHKTLTMANWIGKTQFNFLKPAKFAFIAAFAITVGGGALIYAKRGAIFGMDFTGGYALNLEVAPIGNEAEKVEKALLQSGLTPREFQVRKLHPSNHLRILLSTSLEQAGKPFHDLPLEAGEKNPRIEWIIHALQASEIPLSPTTLSQLENQWMAMSGQMSESMRNNALMGLLLSFICIFVYLAFRFEHKFASAALLCLFCDVLITIGMIGLLHALKVPVQIDLNTIAALMTIIGYSLNDKIIVFDRIREELRLMRGKPLLRIFNSALNATLSRTAITSGTTLLVLLALVALGGPSIFSFSFIMAIGVFLGTVSSWFIAVPLLLLFHREEKALQHT